MRVTIVPIDNTVIVDGVAISNIDMSSVAANVHAVQWDGDSCWIEYTSTDPNLSIDSLDDFQDLLDQYNAIVAAMNAPPTLEQAQTNKVQEAWGELETRLDSYAVTVAVNGVDYQWGCDKESRENIMGINTAIAVGLPVPNPRNWTPKGGLAPVSCTHSDLAAIGGALLAAKDAFMAVYFIHKAAIMTEDDLETVLAYDVTTGWPE